MTTKRHQKDQGVKEDAMRADIRGYHRTISDALRMHAEIENTFSQGGLLS